jgi:hypothetical protein
LTGVIKDRINNDGTLVANYAGHGSVQIWANEHIFDSGCLVPSYFPVLISG